MWVVATHAYQMHEATNVTDDLTHSNTPGTEPDAHSLPVPAAYTYVLTARKGDVYHLPHEADPDAPKCARNRHDRFGDLIDYERIPVDGRCTDVRLQRRRLCRHCDPTVEVDHAKHPREQLCTKLARLDPEDVLADGGTP